MNMLPSIVGEREFDALMPLCSEWSLSIIVPTLNENGNVGPLVQAVERALGPSGWEVIFVDDDSSDGTAAVAKELARRDPRVRCIRRVGRRGLSSAVIEGGLASSADYVAVIDGDLQHDERLLKTMIGILETDQSDLVVASRFAPLFAVTPFGPNFKGDPLARLNGQRAFAADVAEFARQNGSHQIIALDYATASLLRFYAPAGLAIMHVTAKPRYSGFVAKPVSMPAVVVTRRPPPLPDRLTDQYQIGMIGYTLWREYRGKPNRQYFLFLATEALR